MAVKCDARVKRLLQSVIEIVCDSNVKSLGLPALLRSLPDKVDDPGGDCPYRISTGGKNRSGNRSPFSGQSKLSQLPVGSDQVRIAFGLQHSRQICRCVMLGRPSVR